MPLRAFGRMAGWATAAQPNDRAVGQRMRFIHQTVNLLANSGGDVKCAARTGASWRYRCRVTAAMFGCVATARHLKGNCGVVPPITGDGFGRKWRSASAPLATRT